MIVAIFPLLVLLLPAIQALELADDHLHPRHILLHNDVIDTRTSSEFLQESHPSRHFRTLSVQERLDSDRSSLFLVHVEAGHEARSRFRDHVREQFETLQYLPHNSFLVHTTHAGAKKLREAPSVLWVGNLNTKHKIQHSTLDLTGMKNATSLNDHTVKPSMILIATMLKSSTMSDAKMVSQRLRSALESIGFKDITVVRHDRVCIEALNEEDIPLLAAEIAEDPTIVFVERRLNPQKLNQWVRGILQNGLTTAADYQTRTGLVAWDHNLLGQGQVIGMGDSGIDTGHCFYSDSAQPIPFKTHLNNPSAADFSPQDANSRKVIQYVTFADATDDSSGHGTHVAGTAAGSAETGTGIVQQFEGNAPQSKLAFFDIGNPDGSLTIPNDLTDSFLGWAFIAGARVHSNSWGAPSPVYDSTAQDADDFMFNNKDFVMLVAAGNDGSCNQPFTVGTPATAKNIITVGAAMTNLDNYRTTGIQPPLFAGNENQFTENNMAFFSSRGPTLDSRIKPDIVAPGFNTISARAQTDGQAPNTCNADLNDLLAPLSGTSMATPAVAGSVALIRQYFMEGFYPSGQRTASDAFTPSGSLLKAMVISGGSELTGVRLVGGSSSTQSCPNPSFVSIATTPNIDQGWGRLELENVLEFRNESPFFLQILGLDPTSSSTFGDRTIGDGEVHTYQLCIQPTPNNNNTKITLVWTDPPAALNSAVQLVNDLDLEVAVGANAAEITLGNAGVYTGGGPDRRNPVETVELALPSDAAGLQDLRVRVSAQVNEGVEQPYSLVVTGAVRNVDCTTLQTAIDNGQSVDNKGDLTQAPDAPTSQPGSPTQPGSTDQPGSPSQPGNEEEQPDNGSGEQPQMTQQPGGTSGQVSESSSAEMSKLLSSANVLLTIGTVLVLFAAI